MHLKRAWAPAATGSGAVGPARAARRTPDAAATPLSGVVGSLPTEPRPPLRPLALQWQPGLASTCVGISPGAGGPGGPPPWLVGSGSHLRVMGTVAQ
jgi:hypothetical protein